MKFDITNSILFFSRNELNDFLSNFTMDEFNKRIQNNHSLMYLTPFLYKTFYIYKHYDGIVRIWSNSLSMSSPPDYIGGIDYRIYDDCLKLNFFLQDDQKNIPTIENDSSYFLFKHVLRIQREFKKTKIIIKTSLEAYNNFWKVYDFKSRVVPRSGGPFKKRPESSQDEYAFNEYEYQDIQPTS